MTQSRLSITEIAFMLGFSDLSNFIRAFKRWTGKSPTEFKRQAWYPWQSSCRTRVCTATGSARQWT